MKTNSNEKEEAPSTGSGEFKDAAIPPWRFWLLSVGYVYLSYWGITG
jgi:hypothetical protein